MAKLTLADVASGNTFTDTNSTYSFNGTVYTPEWCIVAHDTDGEGITTLISTTRSMITVPWDAKEPANTDENKRDYGNSSYEHSNILQFLNSDSLANEWYEAQHQYDHAPTSSYVNSGYEYADKDAFLAHFADDFKEHMRSVEKMGVTRRVHIAACNEICNNITDRGFDNIVYDKGIQYGTYNYTGISGQAIIGVFRGSHDVAIPAARIDFYSGSPARIERIYTNYQSEEFYPYEGGKWVFPVIYMDSSTPVVYNTTDKKYYASWDNAPKITLNEISLWKNAPFNITFKITDADQDVVSVNVKVDDTEIYSDIGIALSTNITVSVPSDVFSALENGEHTITIIADDSYKQTTKTAKFRKADSVPNVLYTVSENRIFVDEKTTYDDEPIEWTIAAKDVDGDGVVTLMMKNPVKNHEFDAIEPYNPITKFAQYGNNNYGQSNILQWLNAKEKADEWYEDQHSYDYAPSYANEDGFLHNFGSVLLETMQNVTKFGQSRKVHIPSGKEIVRSGAIAGDNYTTVTDQETTYPAFNGGGYDTLTSRQYPAGAPSITTRGGSDFYTGETYPSPYYEVPYIGYRTANSSYSETQNRYHRQYSRAEFVGTDVYPIYTIPVIYLAGNDVPVRIDPETNKYYLDFSVETQYQDYGKHSRGFTVKIKINCGTAIDNTTVKVYVDDGETTVFTSTISQFNQFVDLTIPDSALSSLEIGNHTIRFETDTCGILGSTSITYEKTADSVPTILTNPIGNVVQAFNTTYQVYDDGGDSLDVIVKLDGTQIDSKTDATQYTDIILSITASQINSLSYGNHNIVIEVTDGINTATSTLPFVKNSVPTISLNVHDLGEVLQPVSVIATYDSADGDNITIKAYIDNQEINA